jgi:type II secretory pathway pseudopilin PulG
MRRKEVQSGQAGLVVMLIMVVLLTLGISIASRSTQDVTQSTQEQETSRVFDAAEAGIEQALSGVLTATVGSVNVDIGNGLLTSYTVDEIDSLEVRLNEGHVVGVDLAGYAGDVTLEWSKVSNCATEDPASLEVSIFNSTTNTVRRLAFAGCTHAGDQLISTSNLPSWSVAVGTAPYAYRATVLVALGEDLMRVRPIYNDSHVRVSGGVDFPVQYHRISSQATNPVSGETRAVEVDRTFPTAPSIFDYVLFSGTGISK